MANSGNGNFADPKKAGVAGRRLILKCEVADIPVFQFNSTEIGPTP